MTFSIAEKNLNCDRDGETEMEMRVYCFDRSAKLFLTFVILLIFIPPVLLAILFTVNYVSLPAVIALLILLYTLYHLPLPLARKFRVGIESINARKLVEVSMSRKDVFRAMMYKPYLIRLALLLSPLSAVSLFTGLLYSSYTAVLYSLYLPLYFILLVVESRRSVTLCDAGIITNGVLKKWKDVRCVVEGGEWIYLIPAFPDPPYILPRREVGKILNHISQLSLQNIPYDFRFPRNT